MRWIKVMILGLLGAISLYADPGAEGGLWLLQEDFVKFGKKEVYEVAQKQLMRGLGSKPPYATFSLQDANNSEYLYFTSVKTYGGVEAYFKFLHKLQSASSDQTILRESSLNFVLRTLYVDLPACSSLPKGKSETLFSGFATYFLFGITPGEEMVFEQHLMEMATAQKSLQTPALWKTWKVVIGGDQPRYMVVIFSSTQKAAEESGEALDFSPKSLKQIVRKEKMGSAVVRSDLSS
jgi:hypothetical protein